MEATKIGLYLHIAGGMLGLITGFVNTLNRKGSTFHRNSGKAYVLSMFVATLSGVLLAFLKENQFLFLIGIFSFYLCFSGWRVLKYQSLQPFKAKNLDIVVASITVLFSVFMIFTGIYDIESNKIVINPVLLIFGSGGLFISLADLKKFLQSSQSVPKPLNWLYTHVARMGGSYISAVTAFIVVNFTSLPPLILWLGPSLIGTIFITYSIRKLKIQNQ
jgi:uncharacterized membrane protein